MFSVESCNNLNKNLIFFIEFLKNGVSPNKVIRITPTGVIRIIQANRAGVIQIIPAISTGENLQNLQNFSGAGGCVVMDADGNESMYHTHNHQHPRDRIPNQSWQDPARCF